MANNFRVDNFRSPKTLGYVTIALLATLGVCSFFYFIFTVGMVAYPDFALDLDDGESINAFLLVIGLIAMLEIPIRLATIVMFLVWLYRAYSNLSPLRARNLEFTPGWAVGWWFIPFANLVKPFQVVRETYNESDPEFDTETGFLQTAAGTPALIGFWWASFLTSNISLRIADRAYGSGDLPESEYFPTIFMVAAVLTFIASILAITVVREITKRQDARAARIAEYMGANDAPPAPPVFDKDL